MRLSPTLVRMAPVGVTSAAATVVPMPAHSGRRAAVSRMLRLAARTASSRLIAEGGSSSSATNVRIDSTASPDATSPAL